MENRDQSLFNSGLAKLERIHDIRKILFKFRIADDWENMADCLVGWRDEMDYGFTDEERVIADKYEKDIEGCCRNSASSNPNLLRSINRYSRLLGKIEQRLGLGMPRMPTALDATEIM